MSKIDTGSKYALDYEDEVTVATKYPYAPTRQEVFAVKNPESVRKMMYDAEDVEIAIKAQLDFLVDDDIDLRRRRVAALIFWRIAVQCCKRQIGNLSREKT